MSRCLYSRRELNLLLMQTKGTKNKTRETRERRGGWERKQGVYEEADRGELKLKLTSCYNYAMYLSVFWYNEPRVVEQSLWNGDEKALLCGNKCGCNMFSHTHIFCMKIGVGVVCFFLIITFYQCVNIREKLLPENETGYYRFQYMLSYLITEYQWSTFASS